MKWIKPCDSSACIEVASYPNVVYIRHSAEPDKLLAFTRDEFDAFVAAVVAGRFDEGVNS